MGRTANLRRGRAEHPGLGISELTGATLYVVKATDDWHREVNKVSHSVVQVGLWR